MEHTELYYRIKNAAAWRELPDTVYRAIEIVDAPEQADAEGLADAIEQTPELAAIVLKHMNSPFYAPAEPVTSVQDAVVRLGFEAIRNFMAGYMTEFLLPSPRRRRPQFNLKEYWRHAVATSLAADMLGQKVGYTDTFRLFTHGLIHDIGIIVLEACLPEELDRIVEKIHSGIPQLVAEKSVLGGQTHADIGAWLCDEWSLDKNVKYVIEYHHELSMAPVLTPELGLLYLGNILGTRVYESGMKITLGRSPVDERVLAFSGLTHEDVQQVDAGLDAALAAFEERHELE